MKKNRKTIIANWKMHPESYEIASGIFTAVKRRLSKIKKTEAIICPPALYLSDLAKKARRVRRLSIGAQDAFYEKGGSFTGRISAEMIHNAGASYVILGHSERRLLGETDEIVNKKIIASIKVGLTVIICIGEGERDIQGNFLGYLKNQIKAVLGGVKKATLADVIIAYEPIWAISGNAEHHAISSRELHETIIFIRKVIADIYDRKSAMDLRIIYGGSADEKDSLDLLTLGEADGLLVGRASLDPEKFGQILQIADSIK